MGHDINNLNQIGIGYLELAMEAESLPEAKSLMEKPHEVMKATSEIIYNVRKIRKIKSEGTGVDNGTSVDICKIFNKMQKYYTKKNGRSIKIILADIPDTCIVKANDLIADIFTNIIDNAIKHSDPAKGLEITIRLAPIKEYEKKYIRCSVEDNGPGIADWLKDKIFIRFKRGITKAHGKGLGLYLVRAIVEDFGGRIWVEDRVPGDYSKGAKFVIVFPAA
jgi:signal transduction histidine kinase